ncbi:3D domain-containing protein [Ammoniphilus sp. YIM 78166]|uniref:3D domain-containing protein n=1 Tax=Ammoniphilus sp. YIM 78166 TaxID=1644106 RepID=UPI00143069D9|nr:3D domain-containing protein [Ammoniphilus sp. YIM 78166]
MRLGILVLMLVYFVPFKAAAITDVDEAHWAKASLIRLDEKKMLPLEGKQFRPLDPVTRVEFLAMMVQIMNLTSKNITPNPVFRNFEKGDPYYEEVTIALQYQLLKGSKPSWTDPYGFLTREEMVTIATRLKQPIKPAKQQKKFLDDDDISEWARPAIAFAAEQNWIVGIGERQFNPKQKATRAEVAVLLDRMAFGPPPPLREKVVSVSGRSYEYSKKLSMRSTAYGPHVGSRTATGKRVAFGMVAVDPKVIKLGTKLFVTGYKCPYLPSEGFLAVAEDTGGAIKGNKIDIFINQSRRNIMQYGVQQVDVFILKE